MNIQNNYIILIYKRKFFIRNLYNRHSYNKITY